MKFDDLFGDDPVFVYREQTSNGVYDTWSDGTGDQVHIITVTHPDYAVSSQEVAFDEDQSLTVTMNTDNHTQLKGTVTVNGTVSIY